MSFLGWGCLALWIIFYREIICFAFGFFARSHYRSEESLSYLSGELRPLSLRMIFLQKLGAGVLFFPGWFRSELFVDERLWNSLSKSESEALFIWMGAQRRHWIQGAYLIFPPPIYQRDRQSIFLGAKSLSLSSAFQKIENHRAQHSPLPTAEWLWLGWSPLGPSWMAAWPSLQSRIQRLSTVEAKLKLSPLSEEAVEVDSDS
jgi:hypothetical protein